MELGRTWEGEPPFEADFSQAMRELGEATEQLTPGPETREIYMKKFCAAILAAMIADKRFEDPADQRTTPESLRLQFEVNEIRSIAAIMKAGVKANTGVDLPFPNRERAGITREYHEQSYDRHLVEVLFGRLGSSENLQVSHEQILHSLLVNDQKWFIHRRHPKKKH